MRVVLESLVERVQRTTRPAERGGGGLLQLRWRTGVGAREEEEHLEDVSDQVAIHVGLAEPDVRLEDHLAEKVGAAHAHDGRLSRRSARVAEHTLGAVGQHEPDGAAAREHRIAVAREEREARAVHQAEPRVAREGLPRPVAAPRAAEVDAARALQRWHLALCGQRRSVKKRVREAEHPYCLGGVRRRGRVERDEEVGRVGRQVLEQVDPVADADSRLSLAGRAAPDAVPRRPRGARARHERGVGVQVDGVVAIPQRAEHACLGRARALAQERKRDIGVGGKNNRIEGELARARARKLERHAAAL
eukprot:scaffold42449_cov25-Tisochrysis_lutea.AAC.3